jgi:hypothetical protein
MAIVAHATRLPKIQPIRIVAVRIEIVHAMTSLSSVIFL